MEILHLTFFSCMYALDNKCLRPKYGWVKTVHVDLTQNTNLKSGKKNMITDTTLLYYSIKLIISF